MKGLIHKLSDDLINKIAAGEVIQRPSSVLKELIENSVDANANNIDVVVKDFGKSLIEFSDDGDGMNKNDLSLCFLKHTTSKIKSSSDLFSLTSKGFRGEAISSISSVAKITISVFSSIGTNFLFILFVNKRITLSLRFDFFNLYK